MLGAVVGGALENLALVTGHDALLLVAAGPYSCAWLSVALAQRLGRTGATASLATPSAAARSQHAPP